MINIRGEKATKMDSSLNEKWTYSVVGKHARL